MSTSPTPAWALTTDADGIAWLSFDKPDTSTNVLSRDTLVQLDQHVSALAAKPPRGLVIRSAKASGFIAGADVKEFVQLSSAEQAFELVRAAQKVLDRIEALPFPTVAIIHGFALGGGFELALACKYRVGVKGDKFSIGLPEVMLGIHPGFGGTVRAVRLAGVSIAMEMMLTSLTEAAVILTSPEVVLFIAIGVVLPAAVRRTSRYRGLSSNLTIKSPVSGSTTKVSPAESVRVAPVSMAIAEIDPPAET